MPTTPYPVRVAQATEELETFAHLTEGRKYITLKAAVKTRWWTKLIMLDSLTSNKDAFCDMVKLGKATDVVNKLDWPTIEQVDHARPVPFRGRGQVGRGREARHLQLGTGRRPLPPWPNRQHGYRA